MHLGVAFGAGFLSFFAPCALVLIPAFLANIAGVSFEAATGNPTMRIRATMFSHALTFAAGFTAIFMLLGASAGFLGSFFRYNQDLLLKTAGVLIILFGAVTLRAIKSPLFLQREHKLHPKISQWDHGWWRYGASFVVGAVFAFAWSPCVGPVLGAILTLAGATATVTSGTMLLLFYSLGLMIPFLIVGFFAAEGLRWMQRSSALLKYGNIAAGILLIILGILVFTNQFGQMVGRLYFLSPLKF